MAIAFYTKALIDKRPLVALEQYASADFVEHKPDVPSGNRITIAQFLEGIIKALPEAKWEIVRAVAEKDFVVLHAKFTPAPGAPPYAIADFFRIKNCSVVEHWDVVEPPREGMPNQISQF
ncbi:MAG: nuclear transport factor 2 family protein [Pseudomonadota bacterium]